MGSLIAIEVLERKILLLRNLRVMIDTDLAELYGVTTKRLNEQVKRNRERFPEDFMFQLTYDEKLEVVAKCDHLKTLKFSHKLPYVFTEHGALMAAGVLNTPLAIEVSIFIVRAFVRLRQMLMSHEDLARKLGALEKKYDGNFKVVFEAIRALMTHPETPKKKIGFQLKEPKAKYRKM